MCTLIRIRLTKEASKDGFMPIIWDYKKFLMRGKAISNEVVDEKLTVEMFVRYAENTTSRWLVEVMSKDKRIEKTEIIS